MKKLAFLIVAAAIAGLLWLRLPPDRTAVAPTPAATPPSKTPTPTSTPDRPDNPIDSSTPTSPPARSTVAPDTTYADRHPPSPQPAHPPSQAQPSDPMALLQSLPIVQQWMQQGTTEAEIHRGWAQMQASGFSGNELLDPGLLASFLPRRNIPAVLVEEVTLPNIANAGQSIPFSVHGVLPNSAYTYQRPQVTTNDQGQVQVVLLGDTTGTPAPSLPIPITLEDTLPPLSRGTYTIRFEGLGQPIEQQLTIL